MKALARHTILFAAAIGLAITFAPPAGASVNSGFIIHDIYIPTSFSTVNPCNGQTVDTSGHGIADIVQGTSRAPVEVGISDTESGDGYYFLEASSNAYFDALSSSYTFPAMVIENNVRTRGEAFYESVSVTVSANGDQPTGFHSEVISATCGLKFFF